MTKLTLTSLLALTFVATNLVGCGETSNPVAETDATVEVAEHDHDSGDQEEGAGHNLAGWWCVEHGVPEAECALCDTSLVAEFKAKDDWCEDHNRPDSQCFICEPSRFETFAARYEAKHGEKPPKPAE